ncbi:alpha/beta hydrolase [Actinokineospora cianjurensis]|uniref:Prolyl oligopeptidase family protein n=1 Tax=Actinokineospora cianjurensis TaxID=585224 RepID=A0A421B2I1_9PSEU|nr:prolyl oligopeptidase family serine peptidase [Actinokineospora cianjurensis]RLK58626.1 prolyl oligopeptidase family protein [Actinokineospora cianjurensis]
MRPPITGTAGNVPFTALPPPHDGPAPLIVTWHMMDPPRSDAAFAAALPMTDVPAWRVHLAMPLCGARMVNGTTDAIVDLASQDPLMSFLHPFVEQATDEFPAALAALRTHLTTDDGPIGILGASLGAAVALRVLTGTDTPVRAAAIVNGAIRMRSVVALFPGDYPYDTHTTAIVDDLDFTTKTDTITTPLLIITGAHDHPALHADAHHLATTLGDRAELHTIPDLTHPLAEEPGIVPAPQLPQAREVDTHLTTWFRRHLA